MLLSSKTCIYRRLLSACRFLDRKANKESVPSPYQIHSVISSETGSHLLLNLGVSLLLPFFHFFTKPVVFCTYCWEICKDSPRIFPKKMVGNRCIWKCGSDVYFFFFSLFPERAMKQAQSYLGLLEAKGKMSIALPQGINCVSGYAVAAGATPLCLTELSSCSAIIAL